MTLIQRHGYNRLSASAKRQPAADASSQNDSYSRPPNLMYHQMKMTWKTECACVIEGWRRWRVVIHRPSLAIWANNSACQILNTVPMWRRTLKSLASQHQIQLLVHWTTLTADERRYICTRQANNTNRIMTKGSRNTASSFPQPPSSVCFLALYRGVQLDALLPIQHAQVSLQLHQNALHTLSQYDHEDTRQWIENVSLLLSTPTICTWGIVNSSIKVISKWNWIQGTRTDSIQAAENSNGPRASFCTYWIDPTRHDYNHFKTGPKT
jgi:hypothetical protein